MTPQRADTERRYDRGKTLSCCGEPVQIAVRRADQFELPVRDHASAVRESAGYRKFVPGLNLACGEATLTV